MGALSSRPSSQRAHGVCGEYAGSQVLTQVVTLWFASWIYLTRLRKELCASDLSPYHSHLGVLRQVYPAFPCEAVSAARGLWHVAIRPHRLMVSMPRTATFAVCACLWRVFCHAASPVLPVTPSVCKQLRRLHDPHSWPRRAQTTPTRAFAATAGLPRNTLGHPPRAVQRTACVGARDLLCCGGAFAAAAEPQGTADGFDGGAADTHPPTYQYPCTYCKTHASVPEHPLPTALCSLPLPCLSQPQYPALCPDQPLLSNDPDPAPCPLHPRPLQLPIFMHHLLPLLGLLLPPPKARPGPAAPSVLAHHVPHRAAYLAFFTLAGVGLRTQAQHVITCQRATPDAMTYALWQPT